MLSLLATMSVVACGTETPPIEPDPLPDLSAFISIDLANPLNYEAITFPSHYDAGVLASDNSPADNAITDEGASLGRVLFYDTELSVNRTVSCASCHLQELGFTDADQTSVGFEGGTTTNHSMRLGNARFYEGPEMFWDKRAADIEDQVLQPVMDPVEMGFDAANGGLAALIQRMEATEYYPALFEWVFGTPGITETRMRRALAQFVRSMVSTNSRFDVGFATAGGMTLIDEDGAIDDVELFDFTAEENLGLQLFAGRDSVGRGCQECHVLPTFALDPESGSTGLDIDEVIVFKSPSLKNVAVSGPYMHDGRFTSLLQVMVFYNSQVRASAAVDDRMLDETGEPIRLGLTTDEMNALVAFMGTLTDASLLGDVRFSDPFVN